MDEIYFKKDESKEDKSNDKHKYTVFLTNGKVFRVKATDYDDLGEDYKFIEFYDGDYVVTSIRSELVYAILDEAYAGEESTIVYKEI